MDKEQVVPEAIDQNELVKKVYHTDARVTAMEGEIRQLAGGVSRIESMLLNKPEPNVLGWVGAGMAAIGFIAALLFGVASYIDLRLTPLRDNVSSRGDMIAEYQQFRQREAYDQGKEDEWMRHYELRSKMHDDKFKELQEEIHRLDSEGSRVWERKESLP